MIEAVCQDLGSEVIGDQRGKALALVFAERGQIAGIADLGSLDKAFRKDCLTGQFAVALGAFDPCTPGVVAPETVKVVCLIGEIKLGFRSVFQLQDEILEIQAAHGPFHEFVQNFLNQREVTRDRVHDAGTADLDGYDRTVVQGCLMHLGDGGGAQGLFIKRGVQLTDRLAQVFLNLSIDGFEIHGRHFGTQFRQGVAVFGRQISCLLGCNLSDLHKGGAQILQPANDNLRRDAVIIIVFPQDGYDLFQPAVGFRLGLFCIFSLL